jgi:ferritin-like metal-binding protein YciE
MPDAKHIYTQSL